MSGLVVLQTGNKFRKSYYKHLPQATALKSGWSRQKFIVNTKIIYATGGGIAVAAIAIFFIFGNGSITPFHGNQNPGTGKPMNITLSVKNILATKLDDERASVQVIFSAHNPNENLATLETIEYRVYIGQLRMVGGNIGESPEGMVASQAGSYPIIGNSTVTLSQQPPPVAVRNNLTATAWDSMFAKDAKFRVEGAYSSRIIARLEQDTTLNEFSLTFP